MGGATPVYNRKKFLGVPLGLLWHGIWKVDNKCLVSDTKNFVPPSQNIDQLLQIDVKNVFDSHSSLKTIFILKNDFFFCTYWKYK